MVTPSLLFSLLTDTTPSPYSLSLKTHIPSQYHSPKTYLPPQHYVTLTLTTHTTTAPRHSYSHTTTAPRHSYSHNTHDHSTTSLLLSDAYRITVLYSAPQPSYPH